jgi:hypothetical protein
MTTARRRALSRQLRERADEHDIPAELAAGPCIEIWGQHPDDRLGTRRAWNDAVLEWAKAHGLADRDERINWHLMPPQLFPRTPFHRKKG